MSNENRKQLGGNERFRRIMEWMQRTPPQPPTEIPTFLLAFAQAEYALTSVPEIKLLSWAPHGYFEERNEEEEYEKCDYAAWLVFDGGSRPNVVVTRGRKILFTADGKWEVAAFLKLCDRISGKEIS